MKIIVIYQECVLVNGFCVERDDAARAPEWGCLPVRRMAGPCRIVGQLVAGQRKRSGVFSRYWRSRVAVGKRLRIRSRRMPRQIALSPWGTLA